MEKVFDTYSAYYDLIYKDKNYEREADYVIDLIRNYNPQAKELIEFGSGTGKHAKIFNSKGYTVKGVEPSESMLQIAQQLQNEGLKFEKASIESFSDDSEYDVALSLFHVISYINDNKALLNAFKNINKHLKNDGLFIFDIWYTPAVLSQVPENRVKTVENDLISVTRKATPVIHWNENVIDVVYDVEIKSKVDEQVSRLNETHHMRHFGFPEIELLGLKEGFKILKAEEFQSGNIPGPDTWGVCFIMQKITVDAENG